MLKHYSFGFFQVHTILSSDKSFVRWDPWLTTVFTCCCHFWQGPFPPFPHHLIKNNFLTTVFFISASWKLMTIISLSLCPLEVSEANTQSKTMPVPKQNLVTLKGVWRKQHLQSPLRKGKITQRVHIYYALPLAFALSFRKAAIHFIDFHGLSQSSRLSSCQEHAFMHCISGQLSVKRTAQELSWGRREKWIGFPGLL